MPNLISYLSNPTYYQPLIIILFYFITYGYFIFRKDSETNNFVTDDLDGIAKFSDKFIQYRQPDGKFVKEEFCDWYELDINGKKQQFKNRAFNPHIEFPGNFIRWFRLNWGAKFKQIGTDSKNHKVYGYVQSPAKHHLLSFIIDLISSLLTYFCFSKLFGNHLAFLTVLLYIASPIGAATRAWISSFGYLLCLLGMMASYCLVLYFPNDHFNFVAVGVLTFVSIVGLLPGVFNFLFLIFFKSYYPALAAGLISLYFAFTNIKWVFGYRKSNFIKQNMVAQTVIRPSKIIYAVKTFFYYLRLNLFPKRLGLFHKEYYHHDVNTERPTIGFWLGFISLSFIAVGFYFAPFPVRFGIAWFFIYLLLFSNIMTAMQSVTERYCFIPNLGFCLVCAYFLQDFPGIYGLLLGCYLARSWAHFPTFDNETKFYESNVWNFKHEIPLGNLGVIWSHKGFPGMGVDIWKLASQVNPDYCVPWFNLYSAFKMNAIQTGDFNMLKQSREFLKNCVNCTTVNFKEDWEKELVQFDKEILIIETSGKIQNITLPGAPMLAKPVEVKTTSGAETQSSNTIKATS